MNANHENNVHALWIGKITEIELVTMKSFLNCGATFHLWTYDNPIVPDGVVLMDANKVLPKEKVFLYPSNMTYGHCSNTVIGFSELFRYKVLYDYGGWWSDMDVTCLKPLSEIKEPYFFRSHGVLSVVGNIMKCPPHSDLMKSCFETAEQEISESTIDMFQAIEILCYYVRYYNLRKYINQTACNLDHWQHVERYFNNTKAIPFPENWHFVHWMHSIISDQRKAYNKNSTFGQMVSQITEKYTPIFKPLDTGKFI